ncbi:hypothetical protein RRG08_014994 [Elysia crispata]|uniref:Endonuclease/exonuclease/phosphatase domain-containing protein n=1 Tax=Elysia crispata TaxID=231223 RepID=A0AAE0Y071_9GAST|nr:hypothetical protein RRG08_014994 [Elysia crispata]
MGRLHSHSLAWGYKNLDAKGEDVEDWITSNKLILINTAYDEPTSLSRSWNTKSTPDLAAATDDIQKVTRREVCSQLGGSDHRPVILNVNRDIKLNPQRLLPIWNYKKVDLEKFQEIAHSPIKNVSSHIKQYRHQHLYIYKKHHKSRKIVYTERQKEGLTARVSMDRSTSNLIKLREVVPQGGVLSQILFLTYINDLTSVISKFVSSTLHVDDLAV